MKKNFLLFSALLFALVSCINGNRRPFGRPPASKAFLIVPGKSVGALSLNENRDSILKHFGLPDAAILKNGDILATRYTKHDSLLGGINIFYKTHTNAKGQAISLVKSINVTDSNYRIQEGLGVGDSLINIARIYIVQPYDTFRQQRRLYTTYGTQRGMVFVINPKGVCQSIIIHSQSETDSGVYKPFYH